MNQPWWLDALRWGLFPLLFALAMGAVSASRSASTEPGTLRQPISCLVVGGCCTLFFGFLLYAGNTFAYNETMTVWVSATFAAFALLGVLLVAFYFTDRHTVSATELNFATITGARRSISWASVARIKYSHSLKWFHVEDREGRVARIGVMLLGLRNFAELALKHAPPDAITPGAQEMLLATSEGQLPPI